MLPMNITQVILYTLVLALVPQTASSQPADPLAPVAWLSGCWSAESRELGSGEHWLPPAGGTMLGVSRTVKGGKTVEYEFMQFRVNAEGRLELVTLPSGQRETTFVLVGHAANSEATFENPQHDFPQRVIYRSVSSERMIARIEGIRSGVTRGVDFPMRRIACEALGASVGDETDAQPQLPADAASPRG